MDKPKDKYEFGRCKKCFKNEIPLKNGYCIDCVHSADLPDCFKDLFDGFKNKSFGI